MEHNDDLFGATTEIRLTDPEVIVNSSPPRTSVTEIVSDTKPSDSRVIFSHSFHYFVLY